MSREPSSETSSPKRQVGLHERQDVKFTSKLVLNLLKATITFGILYYLYEHGMLDFSRVSKVLTNIPVMSTCFAVMISSTLAGFFRWWLLLEGQGLRVSKSEALKLTMIGVFFNTAIPGAVSGDVVKGFYVVRQQPDGRGKIRAFTTLLLDRVLGLSALIGVSFLAMALNFKDMTANPTLKPFCGLISMLGAGVVVFYVFVLAQWPFSAKITRLLARLPAGDYFVKLYDAVKAYESCRHYVFKGLAISVAIHCSIIGVFIALSRSLGGFEAVPLDKFFFLTPLGLLVTAIPVAPAGLGTGHAAFFGLYKMVGATGGADLFTAFVTFQLTISLIGGLFYVNYRGHLPKNTG